MAGRRIADCWRSQGRGKPVTSSQHKPAILVTGDDLAPQALELLGEYEVIFAGKAPLPADILALTKDPDAWQPH